MAVTSLAVCACASSSSLNLTGSKPPSPPRVSSSSSPPLLSLSPVDKTLSQIHNSGVIACLRANSADLALKAARAALNGGISALEIVMSTPGVLEVLQQLLQEHPTAALGVGTVLNVEDAKSAINAGAKFLMSPAIVKDIMDDVQCGGVLYIPGVMTPTEILSAHDAGARIVKVYPVSMLGGSQYISALKRPFHHISMVASQGITRDSISEYIIGGASSVVLSDAIFDKEAIGQNNFKKVCQLAQFAALQGIEAEEEVYSKLVTSQAQDSSLCITYPRVNASEQFWTAQGHIELELQPIQNRLSGLTAIRCSDLEKLKIWVRNTNHGGGKVHDYNTSRRKENTFIQF